MREILIVVSLCAVCIAAAAIFRRRRLARQAPPLGMVLLLSRTRPLQASTLAASFGQVTNTAFRVVQPDKGRPVTPADLPEGNAVLGKPPSFLIQAEDDLFVVNSIAKPYASDLGHACEGADAAFVAKVQQEHQAWLSVEILHPEAVSAANYRIVAQVIAELISPDCLALFHPESRKLVPVHSPETLAKLRTQHPINSVFGTTVGLL